MEEHEELDQIAQLEAELDALWDFVQSDPSDPDMGAFNEASGMRDKRMHLGTESALVQ